MRYACRWCRIRARQIIVATGSDAHRPGGIGSLDDAKTAREKVSLLGSGERVLVRGGGLTGIELASELADARPDLKTHLVGRGKIGRQFPGRTRKELVDSLTRSGVILGEPSQDSALEIRATGFRYSGLAERSQLGTDARGRVVLDENLQAVPGIWGPGTRRWFRVGHIFEAGARSLYPWVLMPLTMRFAHSSGARRNRSISPSPSSASAWGATMVSS